MSASWGHERPRPGQVLHERAIDGTFAPLSVRQADVAVRVSHGESNKMIARALGISGQTVKNHLYAVLGLLHCGNRAALARWVTEVEHAGVEAVTNTALTLRYFPICPAHGEMKWSVDAHDLSARCSTCDAPLDASQPRLVSS